MGDKVIGYILVSIGIIVILGATYGLYRVFNGQSEPLEVFKLKGISVETASLVPQPRVPAPSSPSPKIELFPAAMLNTILNTVGHVIFMGFIASVGFRIASIGTMLARPIVVKIHSKKEAIQTPELSS
jgi:hypothetical protein